MKGGSVINRCLSFAHLRACSKLVSDLSATLPPAAHFIVASGHGTNPLRRGSEPQVEGRHAAMLLALSPPRLDEELRVNLYGLADAAVRKVEKGNHHFAGCRRTKVVCCGTHEPAAGGRATCLRFFQRYGRRQ